MKQVSSHFSLCPGAYVYFQCLIDVPYAVPVRFISFQMTLTSFVFP
jgi:hypothetical protein